MSGRDDTTGVALDDLDRIVANYRALVSARWFRAVYEGASLGELIPVEGGNPRTTPESEANPAVPTEGE